MFFPIRKREKLLGGYDEYGGDGGAGYVDILYAGTVAIKPCPINGCSGPANTIINGQWCCLLPCFGWLHNYGYGYVSGMKGCYIV